MDGWTYGHTQPGRLDSRSAIRQHTNSSVHGGGRSAKLFFPKGEFCYRYEGVSDIFLIATTKEGKQIRLTQTVWREKLLVSRPELGLQAEYPEELKKVIEDPDDIARGDRGELLALRWCSVAPKRPKYLCVVYRELNGEGFVITAFFTSRLRIFLRREVLWQRQ